MLAPGPGDRPVAPALALGPGARSAPARLGRRRSIWLFGLVFMAMSLGSCSSRYEARDPDPAPSEGPLLLAFARGPCHGFCPVYWVRVADDGALLYEGEHFVTRVGRHRGQLRPGQLAALRRALADADFFALADRYDHVRYRELPTIVTTYREGGREKTVFHHLGDNGAPSALLELEERIDAIIEIDAWIGSEAERDRLSGL